MALRNITKFPHAQGQAQVPRGDPQAQRMLAMSLALQQADQAFKKEYHRQPDWDIVLFRGCFTTCECLVEIWEES